ncbi:MAG: histidine kinase dimerization/phospho-acceptor domain-containing protein, partial [Deltaproteobacteria bacterium]
MKKSLYWKILSGYLAVTIVTLLVIYAIATNFIRTQTIQRVEDELKAHSKIIALMKTTDVQNNIHSISNATGCRITVVDVHGNVLADTSAELPLENHYNRPEIVEARFKEFGTAVRYSNTLNYDVLYVAIVKQEQGKQINYLRLAKPLANIKASMNKLHNAIFYTAGIAIIPCLLIALFFFMKLIKPIRKIDEYTNQVLSGENPESLRVDSEDEIGNLAKNVNTMFLSQRDKIMQLEEQKQKLAATFANMNEGVMLLNSKQEIETINESMARILNKQREEIIGKTPIEVLRSNKLHDAISRCLIIKETAVIEIVTDDENSTFLEISISSIDNAVVGKRKTIVVFRDVTSLKKLEQSRSDFVANVAHELKTPITAIAGFSQTLLEGVAETNKQKDFLQKINSNSMRLNRLVDDLLTLFELEFGKTHLDITPI